MKLLILKLNTRASKECWILNKNYHRDDGLVAVISASESRFFYNYGKLHRDGGPAVLLNDGAQAWHQNGNTHRDDGPAIIELDGEKSWYLNGLSYSEKDFYSELRKRENKQMDFYIIRIYRLQESWVLNYKLHRINYPAHTYSNGTIYWYKNGKIHRDEGPAVTYFYGYCVWYINGKLIREGQ